ncbi:hypothetical protein HDV05_007829, partial [Chytridiales sp. JEL 0842]
MSDIITAIEDFSMIDAESGLFVWIKLKELLTEIVSKKAEKADQLANSRPKSPVCATKPFSYTNVHGEEWHDDYSWLTDRENQSVLDYIQAENEYSLSVMEPTKPLQRLLYKEFLSRIDSEEETAKAELPDGYFYYSKKVPGMEYKLHCRVDKGTGVEEVYLDENELVDSKEFAEDSFFHLSFLKHSPDCSLVAYGVDTCGNERNRVFFMKMDGSKDLLEDRIEGVYEDFEFSACGQYVFYTILDSQERAYQLKRHKIGDNVENDPVLYHEQDEMFYLKLSKTTSGKAIILHAYAQITSETRYIMADSPLDEPRLIFPRRENIQYTCDHHNNHFYILTNENGRNNWLFRIPIPSTVPTDSQTPESLMSLSETVIEHRDFVLIEDFQLRKNHLIVFERSNCLQNVRIVDISSPQTDFSTYHYISFPENVYSLLPGAVDEEAADLAKSTVFDTNLLRFTYTSFTQPKQVVDYDMNSRTLTVVEEEKVSGGYDRSLYVSKRLFATGVDGTTVPISLVYRRDLLGLNQPIPQPNPLLLHSYGAYGSCTNPTFSATRLSILDRGFIFAIAHVRGGSEMGNAWYDEGKLTKKPNTFHDFISAAEYLCNEGYTSPSKLSIYGRSAGGLLIGAVINMRPDLFKAALTEVPFVDAINTMFDSTIPWTAFEYEEWGNPVDVEIYNVMKGYCPMTNIQGHRLANNDYPNILVACGMNDPRVAFFEPLKFVAKLRNERRKYAKLLSPSQRLQIEENRN